MEKKSKPPLRMFLAEEFKEIELEGKLQLRYAISNYGRLISFSGKMEDGRLLKCSITEGYRIFRYKINQNGKIRHKHKFLYKLVAEQFLTKTSAEQTGVLHLNHVLSNDFVNNLRWATKKEVVEHHKTSPKVQRARIRMMERNRELRPTRDGHKLTITQVMHIKKMLANPNRKTRLKTIAKQFGISEMQLYRIKSGENWGHVKCNG